MSTQAKVSLGIFWDIENCPIPVTKPASGVAKQIRDFVSARHPECGYAKEFSCACDIRRLDPRISEGLNRNGVIMAHVDSRSKNAADDRLQELIDMFVDKFGVNSVLVLITGDINFAKPIRNALRKDMEVVLIHGSNCSQDLKNLVKESYLFEDLLKGVEDMAKDVNQLKPAYLKVSNLPKNKPGDLIIKRLSQMSENCGGKPEKVFNGEAMIRFGCRDDAQRCLQRMSGEDCFGHKIQLKLIEEEMKDFKTQSQQTQQLANNYKSIIKGLKFVPGQNLKHLVQNLVTYWNDSEVNKNFIVIVELQDNGELVVIASTPEANLKLVSAAKRHLKPKLGIEWQLIGRRYEKRSKQKSNTNASNGSFQALKDKRSLSQHNLAIISNTVNDSEDTKSVIKGLNISKEKNVAEVVRNLVNSWNDSKIKANSIVSVERNTKHTKSDGKCNLFVTAISADASNALVTASKIYIKDDTIKWIRYTNKLQKSNSEENISLSTPGLPNGVSEDCKSVIKGLFSKKGQNVKYVVQKLVTDWKDPKINSNLISFVNRSTKYGSGDGKVTLFVTATSAQASQALLLAAKRHLKPSDGIKWYLYQPKEQLNPKTLNQQNSLQNECKSVIKGLETNKDQNVAKTVRKIVMDWKDSAVNANFIVNVERNRKHSQTDGKVLLFVTAESADKCRALVNAAKEHLNPNDGITWTLYQCKQQFSREDDRESVDSDIVSTISSTSRSRSSTMDLGKSSDQKILSDILVSDDCKSIIRGLETKSDQNVAKIVRKLVTDWKDDKIHPNFIQIVERDPFYAETDGKAPLLVTAITAQKCNELIAGAISHLDPSGPVVWTYLKSEQSYGTNDKIFEPYIPKLYSTDENRNDSISKVSPKKLELRENLSQHKSIDSVVLSVAKTIGNLFKTKSTKTCSETQIKSDSSFVLLNSNTDEKQIELKPKIPYFGSMPKMTKEIVINGTVSPGAQRFEFNLMVGSEATDQLKRFGDIAFHFNPRFNQQLVVCNNRINKRWGPEERSQNGIPFALGQAFEAKILIEDNAYKVFVDGRHFVDFIHRIGASNVGIFSIEGSVGVDRIQFIRKQIQQTINTSDVINETFEPIYNPCLPFHHRFGYGLREKLMFCISGDIYLNANGFAIAFHAFSDIAFYFDIRVRHKQVVLKCQVKGQWESDQSSIPCFPFTTGSPFDIMIRIESNLYVIAVNGQHFCDFRHRIALNLVNELSISGDVLINSIRFANN